MEGRKIGIKCKAKKIIIINLLNPLNFLKCPKGVIQRLKIVLVKTHEGLTHYRYDSHVSSHERPGINLFYNKMNLKCI